MLIDQSNGTRLAGAEPPDTARLAKVSAEMEGRSPQEILAWAIGEFGHKLAFATAFGVEGCVLMAMMSQIAGHESVYLFNLDTGYQFEETLALRETIMRKYDLTIQLVRPEESVDDMETRFGGPIHGVDPDQCCQIRKVVPLDRAVKGYGAWISSIRRDQSPTRSSAPIVHWDKKFELVKVNPLASWTRKDVWSYVFKNEVPYNPLHDTGFTSIGCKPCTRAVSAGDDERAGRWASFDKKECGIHVPNFQI